MPEAVPYAIDIAVLGFRDAMTQATLEEFAYEESLDIGDVSIDDLYPEEIEVIEQATQEYYLEVVEMVKNIDVAPRNVDNAETLKFMSIPPVGKKAIMEMFKEARANGNLRFISSNNIQRSGRSFNKASPTNRLTQAFDEMPDLFGE
jgi:hypothetical protein